MHLKTKSWRDDFTSIIAGVRLQHRIERGYFKWKDWRSTTGELNILLRTTQLGRMVRLEGCIYHQRKSNRRSPRYWMEPNSQWCCWCLQRNQLCSRHCTPLLNPFHSTTADLCGLPERDNRHLECRVSLPRRDIACESQGTIKHLID